MSQRASSTSSEEEFAYFVAKTEIDEGTYSEGLMSKAFSLVGNHGEQEQAKYIELRANQLLEGHPNALEQLRMEWMVKTEQDESRGDQINEPSVIGYDGFKEQLERKYRVSDNLKKREALRQELDSYNKTKARIYSAEGKLLASVVVLLFWIICLVAQFPLSGSSYFAPVLGALIFISISLCCVFLVKVKNLKKHFRKDSVYKIKAQIKEVSFLVDQFESGLDANPGYSNSAIGIKRFHRN